MMSMPVRLSEPNSDHLQEVWRSMSPVKYDKAMHSSDSTFLQGLPAATDTSLGRLITSLRETSSKPIVLVDVGCGTGTEEKRMAEAGVFDSIERVIGVDFNPLFVEEATRINTCAKVSFVCGDACDLEKGKKCSYFLVNVSGASLRSAARSSCDTESLSLPFVFYFLFPKLMFPYFSFFSFSPCPNLICFQVLEPLGILSGEYHIIAASFDNTHGILPEDVMGKINRSMASIGHTIFIGFFDAGAFERGTKEFYGKVFSLSLSFFSQK